MTHEKLREILEYDPETGGDCPMTDEVANLPAPLRQQSTDIFSDPAKFEFAQRVAKVFAASKLVPQHLRDPADILIALQIAHRLGEEPLTVMQNIYVVSGKPGWLTAYMISRANKAGIFQGRITWTESGKGDDLTVTANAVLADTGEEISATVDMRMAKAEQWTRNSKYQSMPAHMLRWRSAGMLIRLYCPEVMVGLPLIDEIDTDQPREVRDVTPIRTAAQSLDDFAGSIEHMVDTANGNAKTESEVMQDSAVERPNGTNNIPPRQPEASAAAGVDIPSATPDEYAAAVRSYISEADDADLLETRWRMEKQLRSRLGVSVDEAKELGTAVLAKAKELRTRAA